MGRVAVDFLRWPRRERSADIRSDLGQVSNAGQRQKRNNPPGASQKGRLAASLLRCSPLRGCASLAPCQPPLLALRAAHSSISTVSYEHSRLLLHRCFFAKLCSSPARFEKSDGSLGNERSAELSVRFTRCYRHSSNDSVFFSHPWSAPKVRPQLSLSVSRFERDFHHADSRGSVEGKVKPATYRWRSADQRRYRARFNELEFRPVENFEQILD